MINWQFRFLIMFWLHDYKQIDYIRSDRNITDYKILWLDRLLSFILIEVARVNKYYKSPVPEYTKVTYWYITFLVYIQYSDNGAIIWNIWPAGVSDGARLIYNGVTPDLHYSGTKEGGWSQPYISDIWSGGCHDGLHNKLVTIKSIQEGTFI